MKYIAFLLCFLTFTLNAQKVDLDYYLPKGNYDENIPTPEEFLGYQVGEWHVTHDQLYYYMKELADKSDRIILREHARSHENRPLVHLIITATKNHENLESIRKQHVALTDSEASARLSIDEMPVVVYQGYSIHGNESSGSNAALMVGYYLAASKDKEVLDLLDNAVVILDPSFNPDGLHRFATWANMHKSKTLVSDPNSREFSEEWPGGRTNHYWFDLNRDWLPAQHPESQGRLNVFHEWKPNILTDHHEMGSNSTYFFQPGVPQRTNPLTPQRNQDLTYKIADFHAKELDKIGSLYYAQEGFDDFYYGKGSTYPDVNGCIGILFEQASSRGHYRQTSNGILTFPFTIRNQVKTSISTLKAGLALRTDLLNFQREFYASAKREAANDKVKAYIFSGGGDPMKLAHFKELLGRHQIKFYQSKSDINKGGQSFKKEDAYIVPLAQDQYRLAKAFFETRTSFKDSLFYDVSTWTMPRAFNLPYAELDAGSLSLGEAVEDADFPKGTIKGDADYAYLFEWDGYYAPRMLHSILKSGLYVKMSNKAFQLEGRKYKRGTVMVRTQNQNRSGTAIRNLLEKLADKNGIDVYAVSTGWTEQGIDLGSPSLVQLKRPKVLMVVGTGVTSYDAGEIWHLLDQRYEIPLTMVETGAMSRVNLDDYTAIIMPNGSYGAMSGATSSLKSWVQAGGTLIAFRSAVRWLKNKGMANVEFKKVNHYKHQKRSYSQLQKDGGSKVIGGAIYNNVLDLAHPLCFGYHQKELATFRRGTLFFEAPENPYAAPLRYTAKPLLSGYSNRPNKKAASNASGIIVSGLGRGKVICFADNPNFRAFWYGTNKLFANAVLFGNTISNSSAEYGGAKEEGVEEDAHGHGHEH